MKIDLIIPPDQVLDLELEPNQVNAATVREYLKALLATLWERGPFFDAKRPWGLSSWKAPIEESLIRARLVPGVLDEDGCVEQVNDREVDSLIRVAIEAL